MKTEKTFTPATAFGVVMILGLASCGGGGGGGGTDNQGMTCSDRCDFECAGNSGIDATLCIEGCYALCPQETGGNGGDPVEDPVYDAAMAAKEECLREVSLSHLTGIEYLQAKDVCRQECEKAMGIEYTIPGTSEFNSIKVDCSW